MQLSIEEIHERRRSPRAGLQAPVVVKWVGQNGSPQQEATKTDMVNAHGCLVLLNAFVSEGMDVEVINTVSEEIRKGRVAFSGEVSLDGRNKVAIQLAEPEATFWGPRYADFARWVTQGRQQL